MELAFEVKRRPCLISRVVGERTSDGFVGKQSIRRVAMCFSIFAGQLQNLS